jgi:hypothetical protein
MWQDEPAMNDQHGRASRKASGGADAFTPECVCNRVARSEIRLVGDPDVIVEQILGLALGTGAVFLVSYMMTRATGIVLPAEVGTNEPLLVAGMLLFSALVSTIPAFVIHRQSVTLGSERSNDGR